jgi:hypothetical protein
VACTFLWYQIFPSILLILARAWRIAASYALEFETVQFRHRGRQLTASPQEARGDYALRNIPYVRE